MDLNHRPLPYQGSALTELSYRPMRADKAGRHTELGYRKPRPDVQSVSLSVTSIPPASMVTRLYRTEPMVALIAASPPPPRGGGWGCTAARAGGPEGRRGEAAPRPPPPRDPPPPGRG